MNLKNLLKERTLHYKFYELIYHRIKIILMQLDESD